MDALTLSQRQQQREAEGRPESLTELRDRVKFAAGWQLDKARNHGEAAGDKSRELEADGIEPHVRETMAFIEGYESGTSLARRDAARILDSIAEALDALIGG